MDNLEDIWRTEVHLLLLNIDLLTSQLGSLCLLIGDDGPINVTGIFFTPPFTLPIQLLLALSFNVSSLERYPRRLQAATPCRPSKEEWLQLLSEGGCCHSTNWKPVPVKH